MTFPPKTAEGWTKWDGKFLEGHPEYRPETKPEENAPPPDPRIPDDREEET